jgi:hypothetical protein
MPVAAKTQWTATLTNFFPCVCFASERDSRSLWPESQMFVCTLILTASWSSHHGIDKRAAAHARRGFWRKNGKFLCAQFCTEVARPSRFERVT